MTVFRRLADKKAAIAYTYEDAEPAKSQTTGGKGTEAPSDSEGEESEPELGEQGNGPEKVPLVTMGSHKRPLQI